MEGDELRLGDVVDDHCSRCHMVTNHSIVAIVSNEPAVVRCRTCSNEHKFRKGKSGAKKKASKKAELFDQVLSKITGAEEQ
jgi:hypothetical protein